MSEVLRMEKFLSTTQAAEYLHLKPSTLIKWRNRENRGPAVCRLAVNRATYAVSELDRYAASKTQAFPERQSSAESRP